MNNKTRYPRVASVASAMIALGCLTLVAPPAYADDVEQAKLKELQRALSAPPEEEAPVFSTKAIVFDKEPAPSRNEAPPQAAQAHQAATDCGLLPADVKTTAVDFEIQFGLGSANLSSASENTLLQIAKLLALTPGRCVFVEGHTDSIGNPDSNLTLSRERANTVVKFIVEKAGIQRERLIATGKGSTEPLRNLDPRNPKNRRVTFKVAG